MRGAVCLALASMFLGTAAAQAQQRPQAPPTEAAEPAIPPSRPPQQLAQLTQVLAPGSYRCEGTSRPPGAPEHPVRATAKVERDLNGFWIATDYTERKTRENPTPMEVQERFSYDPAAGQFVRVAVDSFGGHSVLTAPRLEDGRVVFSGESSFMGRSVPTRMSFAQVGPREVEVRLEIAETPGQFVTMTQLACRR